jgi:hypothetical protein
MEIKYQSKEMGKKKDDKIKNLNTFQRMNFSYQAATLFSNDPRTQNLSRLYTYNFKKIMQRNVLRWY